MMAALAKIRAPAPMVMWSRDSHSPSQLRAIFNDDTAGQPEHSSQHTTSTDDAIVSNLTKVINLGSLADNRCAELGSIHTCPCSDFHVVVNLDGSQMRYLHQCVAVRGLAIVEPIGPDTPHSNEKITHRPMVHLSPITTPGNNSQPSPI